MNIPLKRRFVICFGLFFALSFPLKAEEPLRRLFSFSLETTLGFFYGRGEEIVYKDNSDKYLSELLWDIKPLLYYGSALSLGVQIPSWPFGFYTNLSVKLGIAGRSGFIEDRDWMHRSYDYLTHYSKHDSYIENARFFDGDLGASFPLRPGRAFNPAISFFGRFSYMELKWIARDGYTQYGNNNNTNSPVPWEDSFPKIEFTGPGIQYTQTWILVSPGIAASFPLPGFFTLEGAFTISPFVWAAAEDLHLFENKRFKDYPRGGLALEPQIRALFSPNSRCSLSLKVSWRFMRGAKGDSWVKAKNAESYTPEGIAGAGFRALDAGISFKVHF